MSEIVGRAIVIGTRFHVVWDTDHPTTQTRFLQRIDPHYFQYSSDLHASHLETQNRARADIALRSNYSHAIECLFSLIGAAIQAPHCPAAWITMASNANLADFVRALSEVTPLPNALGLDPIRWRAVVEALNQLPLEQDALSEHIDSVERLWRYLGSQFLDDDFRDEYNSIKHGLRVRSTPWFLNMGLETSRGVPSDRMVRWADSDSGSNFLRKVRLKENHWQLRDGRSNWDPQDFVTLMPLIVRSIADMRDLLLVTNGADPINELPNVFLASEMDEAMAFRSMRRGIRFAVWDNISGGDLPDLTQEEIAVEYMSTFGNVR